MSKRKRNLIEGLDEPKPKRPRWGTHLKLRVEPNGFRIESPREDGKQSDQLLMLDVKGWEECAIGPDWMCSKYKRGSYENDFFYSAPKCDMKWCEVTGIELRRDFEQYAYDEYISMNVVLLSDTAQRWTGSFLIATRLKRSNGDGFLHDFSRIQFIMSKKAGHNRYECKRVPACDKPLAMPLSVPDDILSVIRAYNEAMDNWYDKCDDQFFPCVEQFTSSRGVRGIIRAYIGVFL